MTIEINDDEYPFTSVVHIKASWGGETFVGSGALIGSNDVLTASHVIYQENLGGLADVIKVYPSYDPDDGPFQPYFEPYNSHYYTDFDPDGDGLIYQYNDTGSGGMGGAEIDIALLSLEENVGSTNGFFGADPNFSYGPVAVVGYPGKYDFQPVYDEGIAQKVSYANFIQIISGLEINSGNSGGPVYYMDAGNPMLVGVVSTGIAITSIKEHWGWLTEAISSNDYRPSLSTYNVVALTESVNEGEIAKFRIDTTQLIEGTLLSYLVSGVTIDDIEKNSLAGKVSIDSNGQAFISFKIISDQLSEGVENLYLTVNTSSTYVQINDTSRNSSQTDQTINYNNSDVYVGGVQNGLRNGEGSYT